MSPDPVDWLSDRLKEQFYESLFSKLSEYASQAGMHDLGRRKAYDRVLPFRKRSKTVWKRACGAFAASMWTRTKNWLWPSPVKATFGTETRYAVPCSRSSSIPASSGQVLPEPCCGISLALGALLSHLCAADAETPPAARLRGSPRAEGHSRQRGGDARRSE